MRSALSFVLLAALGACKHAPPSAVHPGDAGAEVVAAPAPRAPAGVVRVTLLANGHVLMPMKDRIFEWDPVLAAPEQPAPQRPFRSASLGDAGPAHTVAFPQRGGRRFVVAKSDDDDHVIFELWDAEALVRIADLGTYEAEEPAVVYSADGTHAMLLACSAVRAGKRHCEVGVHEVAGGALVHRTRVPPWAVEQENISIEGKLGPGGRYFVLWSDGRHPVEAWDAVRGRLVVRTPYEAAAVTEQWWTPFALLDRDRLLTVAHDGRVYQITDLAKGRRTTLARPPAPFGHDVATYLAPDRRHLASIVALARAGYGLRVWDLEENVAQEHAVPREICADACELRWTGPGSLVAWDSSSATRQLSVDIAAGKATVEPFAAPGFFDDARVRPREIEGDYDLLRTTAWHPEGSTLVSPRGARFDAGKLGIAQGLAMAAGDRFLVDGENGVLVLAADDQTAALLPRPPSR